MSLKKSHQKFESDGSLKVADLEEAYYEEKIVPMNQSKINTIQKSCGSFGKLKAIQSGRGV